MEKKEGRKGGAVYKDAAVVHTRAFMNLTEDQNSLTLFVDLVYNCKLTGLDKMVSPGPSQLYDFQIPLILYLIKEGSDEA